MAILPGKGPVADAANAIREGLRAANGADDTAAKPTLSFIASDQPNKIAEAYEKAVGGGGDPGDRAAAEARGGCPGERSGPEGADPGPEPGDPPGKAAANLYQFALAPETEAVEVANKAKAMGFTRALMLAPKGEAGQRRAEAFRRQWQRLGGTLVGEAGFDPAAANLTKTVNALLGKGKADFLFLAADEEQARKIYPAIRDGAIALPVIATSAVYSGKADAARDKALAGLYFVDAPWVLGVGAADDPLARAKLKGTAPRLPRRWGCGSMPWASTPTGWPRAWRPGQGPGGHLPGRDRHPVHRRPRPGAAPTDAGPVHRERPPAGDRQTGRQAARPACPCQAGTGSPTGRGRHASHDRRRASAQARTQAPAAAARGQGRMKDTRPARSAIPRPRVGEDKERLAAAISRRQGLRLIARNHRCRFGEIDLIMGDVGCSGLRGGPLSRLLPLRQPAQTVDHHKQRRLCAAANHYLQAHPSVLPCRFDVVAIGAQDQIQWIKNAFGS